MDRPFVERLHIVNYGCIRNATFTLTPLHALIGPNDSGKSTVLRALRTLAFLNRPTTGSPDRESLERSFVINKNGTRGLLEASSGGTGIEIEHHSNGFWAAVRKPMGPFDSSKVFSWEGLYVVSNEFVGSIKKALLGSELLRFDPDALRAPNALIQNGQPLRFQDQRGTGLAAIYDALMVRDLPAFLELNKKLSELFPSVKAISLINPTSSTKAMGVKLVDGTFVPAELMSEGLLYYLAFAAIPYLDPTAILLIEEPENGLHPARIAEVMRVLREISKTTQVLIATHSPLVINELQGNEVTVVTRTREEGTKATLLKNTPNFEERSKVYALGELWVSYANGEDEAPLLQGGSRP